MWRGVMKKNYKIPFDRKDCEMLPWTSLIKEEDNSQVIWLDNYIFNDDLLYIKYSGGRSSMSMILQSLNDGKRYYMFWKYFDQCIRRPDNQPGPIFSGKWTFIKIGCNYSIKPVD